MNGSLLSACLFLLLDASGSVDAQEHKLQREATAAALTSPEFLARVEYQGGIAVAVAEFSNSVSTISDWIAVRSPAEAAVLAEKIIATPRVQDHSTAVGDAVNYAVGEMARAPACERPVIDVSTDGPSNQGATVDDAVNYARANGVMVNALVIEEPTEPGLLDYYRQAVNGFALPAEWATYEQSLKMKLTLEIANAPSVLEADRPVMEYVAPYGDRRQWGAVRGSHQEDAEVLEVQTAYIPRQYLDLSNDIRRRVPAPGTGGLLSLAAGSLMLAAAWRKR